MPWCALAGQQMALDLRAPGVGGDDAPAWCWSAPDASSSKGAGSGKPGASGGAPEPTSRPPSLPTMSPTAFTTAIAPTTTSPSRADALPRPPVRAVLGAPPLGHRGAAARTDPTRREDGVGILGGGERGAARRRAPAARRRTRRGRRSPPPARSAPARPASGSRGPARRGLHHAVGGGQPERRTAGEHDRVDVLDGARAGRAPRSRASRARRPRISTEPTVLGGSSTTVTPVSAPVQCPACTPGTSVITSTGRGGGALVERAGAGAAGLALARELHDRARRPLRCART